MPSKARLKSQYPLPTAAGGLGAGFISGLFPTWGSGTLTIGTGQAYVPGLNQVLEVTTPLTLTGISGLTTDVFYYVYLYSNAGAPAIELSATVPTAPYSGSARTKTGDTSRRFICPLRSGSGGTLYAFQHIGGVIYYVANTAIAPFRRLSGGTSTSYVTVALSTVVPPTTQTAVLRGSAATGVSALGCPLVADVPMSLFDAGARYQLVFPTDTAQAVQYVMLSAGNFTLDVCGYGMDR